jgi:multiple sugar transport system substrate-binding protein
MARVTRRNFLKVSGAGALAAKTGGMAGILAASKAPAYAQATSVHWLKWNDFVPAGDQILRQSMMAEAEKALGFKLNLSMTCSRARRQRSRFKLGPTSS